jgi:hypothetical protein
VDDRDFSKVTSFDHGTAWHPDGYNADIVAWCVNDQYATFKGDIPPAGSVATEGGCALLTDLIKEYEDAGYIEKIPELQGIEPPKKYTLFAHNILDGSVRHGCFPIATYGYANLLDDGTYKLTWTNAQPFCSHDKATHPCGCKVNACCEPEILMTYKPEERETEVPWVRLDLSQYKGENISKNPCTFWVLGEVVTKGYNVFYYSYAYYNSPDAMIGWVSEEGELIGLPSNMVLSTQYGQRVPLHLFTICLTHITGSTGYGGISPKIPDTFPVLQWDGSYYTYQYAPFSSIWHAATRRNGEDPFCERTFHESDMVEWLGTILSIDQGLTDANLAVSALYAETRFSYFNVRTANSSFDEDTGIYIVPADVGIYDEAGNSQTITHNFTFYLKTDAAIIELLDNCGCRNVLEEFARNSDYGRTVEQSFIFGYKFYFTTGINTALFFAGHAYDPETFF